MNRAEIFERMSYSALAAILFSSFGFATFFVVTNKVQGDFDCSFPDMVLSIASIGSWKIVFMIVNFAIGIVNVVYYSSAVMFRTGEIAEHQFAETACKCFVCVLIVLFFFSMIIVFSCGEGLVYIVLEQTIGLLSSSCSSIPVSVANDILALSIGLLLHCVQISLAMNSWQMAVKFNQFCEVLRYRHGERR